jgi:hypothetical protein
MSHDRQRDAGDAQGEAQSVTEQVATREEHVLIVACMAESRMSPG